MGLGELVNRPAWTRFTSTHELFKLDPRSRFVAVGSPPMTRALLPSLASVASLLAAGPALAVTTFSGTLDDDFNNAGNWDNGLPTGVTGPGTIASGATAVMSADYLMNNNGSPSVTPITVDGSLSTGSYELQLRSGGIAGSPDLTVTGQMTVNNGGLIDLAGAAADLFLQGGGDLTVENGGSFGASKTVDIGGGSILAFESGALMTGNTADELQLRNNSTISFEVAADGSHFTLVGSSLQVRLGSSPNLVVDFLGTPTTGSSFDLITGVSGFTNYLGNGSGYTFDPSNVTVTGLDAGQEANLVYGSSLTLEVVPEPASGILAALGLALVVRRRRP